MASSRPPPSGQTGIHDRRGVPVKRAHLGASGANDAVPGPPAARYPTSAAYMALSTDMAAVADGIVMTITVDHQAVICWRESAAAIPRPAAGWVSFRPRPPPALPPIGP